jgi:sterol desaturase/sphingolipid hydroxylase (fatty acid hydroxylase superfamily)
MLLSAGVKAAAVAALGPPVLGVLAFEIALNVGSLFGHANLRLPAAADRALRVVLVTPDMHRVHHSVDPAEQATNFGFTLSWWDRLLGTYRAQPRLGHDAMPIGVAGFDAADAVALHRLLAQPVRREVPADRASARPAVARQPSADLSAPARPLAAAAPAGRSDRAAGRSGG